MNYAYLTNEAVNELLKFKIYYCKTNNTFLFNNKWINEIDEYYYAEKIDNIKKLLHQQLINGLKHAEYLQNLLDLIETKIDQLDKYKFYSFEFFKLYSKKIKTLDSYNTKPSSNIELFEKFKTDSSSINTAESDLFNFLNFKSPNKNFFATELDFEKGIMLHVLSLHSEVLANLHGFIYSIHMNAEFIDFKNLRYEDIEHFYTAQKKDQPCHFNLDKKSIAYLFRVLIEENIIVFNESDINKNVLEMKTFVQNNFTYLNDQKEHIPIKNFNREYSEMKSREEDPVKKQMKTNEFLLNLFEKRKNELIKIENKNS